MSLNGGEIIAQRLQQYGVNQLFTLCGGHISPIFVAAEKMGIRVIDTRHEATAVFAADAISRLTGVPGVAAVTAGPGLTNTITAIKNAQLAQSPLILLGGAAATLLKGRGSLQDIDQLALMKPNVKWMASIKRVKDIPSVIDQAFFYAQSGVPGPVYIECPVDILYPKDLVLEWYGAKSSAQKPVSIKEKIKQWYILRHANRLFAGSEINATSSFTGIKKPKCSSNTISSIAQKLENAKRPLMIIGSGAISEPSEVSQLAKAVHTMGIPVYLSGMARGLLGKNSPLHFRHKRKVAIKNADLIVLAGVPNDFRLDYGNHIGRRTCISINLSKRDLYLNKKPTMAVLADPSAVLCEVSERFSAHCTDWLEELKKREEEREAEILSQEKKSKNGINPISFFKQVEKSLPENVILVADGGDFVATASYILRPRNPLSWLDPGVFGTLGVGAGFALGAKVAFPEKEVWVIYGDGSAGYSLMEWDTLVRHNLPVGAIIGNDACWNQIARDQIEILHSSCAVKLDFSDYHHITNMFGGNGYVTDSMDEIPSILEKARASMKKGIPCILNVKIAPTDFRKGSISM